MCPDFSRHAQLLDGLPEPIYELDSEGRFTYVNNVMCNLVGYSSRELLDMSVEDITEDEFSGRILAYIGKAGTDPSHSESISGTIFTKDGTEIPVETDISIISGNGVRIAGVFRDVTEQQERLAELERYESILEAVPDPVWATDETGEFIYFNEATVAEYELEETDTLSLSWGDVVPDTYVPQFMDAADRLLSEDTEPGEKEIIYHTSITNSGRKFQTENHFSPQPTEDGFGAVGIARNISERERRKQRLAILHRVLRHNLRNEMSVILSLTGAIREETANEQIASWANKIESTGSELIDRSETIREVSELIESTEQYDGGIDAVGLIEDLQESFLSDWSDTIRFESELPDKAMVRATETLHVALEELLENAIVHNDKETPLIETSISERQLENNEYYRIEISDNGPGIPEQEQSVIFGDEQITQLSHGSGVGLWIARWIIEAYGGELGIRESSPDGSVIRAELPKA